MARLVVMYKTPRDVAAFDKHYTEKHIPLAKKIPGVRKYEISKGGVATPGGPAPYHLIAILHFDDMAAVQKPSAAPKARRRWPTCRPSQPAAPTSSCLRTRMLKLMRQTSGLSCSAKAEHPVITGGGG